MVYSNFLVITQSIFFFRGLIVLIENIGARLRFYSFYGLCSAYFFIRIANDDFLLRITSLLSVV